MGHARRAAAIECVTEARHAVRVQATVVRALRAAETAHATAPRHVPHVLSTVGCARLAVAMERVTEGRHARRVRETAERALPPYAQSF